MSNRSPILFTIALSKRLADQIAGRAPAIDTSGLNLARLRG